MDDPMCPIQWQASRYSDPRHRFRGNLYGDSYLNDWLRQEFSARVSKKRKVVLTDRLSHGLKLVHAAVSKEMEEEEERLLEAFLDEILGESEHET